MRDGRGIVLDLDANASLEAPAARYGDRIAFLSGRVVDRLGVSAALIRPDGIVAWATDGTPDSAELEAALERWFAPSIQPEMGNERPKSPSGQERAPVVR